MATWSKRHPDDTQILIRIPKKVKERVTIIAKLHGLSATEIFRELIQYGLREFEANKPRIRVKAKTKQMEIIQ